MTTGAGTGSAHHRTGTDESDQLVGEEGVTAGAHEAPRTSRWASLGAAVKEFLVVVAMALVLSFVVKTWLVQAFYIPSGSMEDTLLINDRVIVNKLVPGTMSLARGDIVVFEDPGHWLPPTQTKDRGPLLNTGEKVLSFVGLLPDMADNHLIKRVIGLPGDTVACCDAQQRLTVNGAALREPYIKPGDVPSAMAFSVKVPAGRIWVMGDHRSDSDDSRYHDVGGDGADGSVPLTKVTGRAVLLVWPFDRFTRLANPKDTFAGVPAP